MNPAEIFIDLYVYRPELIVRRYNAPGILIVTNTIEKFKTTDKEQLLKETSALVRPSYIHVCVLLCKMCSDMERHLFWSGHY